MATGLRIDPDGSFELNGNPYHVPEQFSSREVYSYQRLLEPIPEIPGGTTLDDQQLARQRAFLLRRAAACVIPGLQVKSLEALPMPILQSLHRWIARNRPVLAEAYQEFYHA